MKPQWSEVQVREKPSDVKAAVQKSRAALHELQKCLDEFKKQEKAREPVAAAGVK